MAQYPIPQFIESEGRIISFLTFRQFFVLVGGGAICLLLYYTLPTALFALFSLIIMLTAAAIAFLKVNNESVVTALLHFLKFSTANKDFTWKKKESTYPFKMQVAPKIGGINNLPEIPTLQAHPSKLGGIKKMVETKK